VSGEELGDAMSATLGDAVASAVEQHEHGMVVKWICLVETIDAQGTRGLWPLTSEGVMAWDTKGMLLHALDLIQGQTIHPPEESE
jgi:hypothetical protein